MSANTKPIDQERVSQLAEVYGKILEEDGIAKPKEMAPFRSLSTKHKSTSTNNDELRMDTESIISNTFVNSQQPQRPIPAKIEIHEARKLDPFKSISSKHKSQSLSVNDDSTDSESESQHQHQLPSKRTVTANIQMTTTNIPNTLRRTSYGPFANASHLSPPNHDMLQKSPCSLCVNFHFCVRIFALILSMLILLLSISYCVAQLLQVKLDIITPCNEEKSLEEIWQHSYESSIRDNGEIVIDEVSQFGHTDESCWTTQKIEINVDQIWYSNKYIHEWNVRLDSKCILFGCIAFYVFMIIFFGALTLIADIVRILQGTLHQKSPLYKQYVQRLQTLNLENTLNQNKPKERRQFCKCVHRLCNIYTVFFYQDCTGWIVMKFLSEFTEFFIQSQALLLYNGYNVFDPNNENDVYLANKSDFILTFAMILTFNAFGSGSLWLFYAVFPKHCHGTIYKRLIFFIDKFSDLLYIFFPFYMLLMDDYNTNTNNIFVLLGQLNMSNWWNFTAAFFPLFTLSSQCLLVTYSATKRTRNESFKKWKARTVLGKNPIHDAHGKDEKRSWIDKGEVKLVRICKRCCLMLFALLFIAFGLSATFFTMRYIETREEFCHSVAESNYYNSNITDLLGNISISDDVFEILQDNPELFFWDKCLYKVYPFGNTDDAPCQCRVMVIDWSDLQSTAAERNEYFDLTQADILRGMLEHWYMLEKFKTTKVEGSYFEFSFNFTASLYVASHMRAFEWTYAVIDEFENGISNWKSLEYLKFEETEHGAKHLPNDYFDGLSEIKFLSLHENGLLEIPSSICNLTSLTALEIEWEQYIESLPHCMDKLTNLQVLHVDLCLFLKYIPISIFNLENLVTLSIFKAYITYQNILQYNVPSNVNINDTEAVHEWMNNNFKFNDNEKETEYHLSASPLCQENITQFPSKLQQFMMLNSTCYTPCDSIDFCIPRKYADGKCDQECQIKRLSDHPCAYDGGDCIQLCFANPELTNCSYDKFFNGKCDDGCNNDYCSKYPWGSNFNNPYAATDALTGLVWQADDMKCLKNENQTETNVSCAESSIYSPYLDPNIPQFIDGKQQWKECSNDWIGDGKCDDACRTDQCGHDDGDCDIGCVDDDCALLYDVWSLGSGGLYTINHTIACRDMIGPIMRSETLYEGDSEDNEVVRYRECISKLNEYDFNKDGHVNFREFIAGVFDDIWSDYNYLKALQMNCSCLGIDYYNI